MSPENQKLYVDLSRQINKLKWERDKLEKEWRLHCEEQAINIRLAARK